MTLYADLRHELGGKLAAAFDKARRATDAKKVRDESKKGLQPKR